MDKTQFERWLNEHYKNFPELKNAVESSTYSSGKSKVKSAGSYFRRYLPDLFTKYHKRFDKNYGRKD